MVSVKIVNENTDCNTGEYNAAKDLQKMLVNSLPQDVEGKILIAYSLTLAGQSPRDVDLLLVGKLDNYILPNYYTNNSGYPKKALSVDSFCIAIELKQHTCNYVRRSGTDVEISYKGYWKSATAQNEGQRYSVRNYFENILGYAPWVSNFIWLKSLTPEQIGSLRSGNPIGALGAAFTFRDLVDTLVSQDVHIEYDKLGDEIYHIRACSGNADFISDFEKNFSVAKKVPAGLTRRKLEILQQKKAGAVSRKKSLGENLTVISGKPGTGKTFDLIQTALHLANHNTGDRCLMLTYNHALVSDVRRLLHFMDIPDRIDSYTIQIQTLHSFFMAIMKAMCIDTDHIFGPKFDHAYKTALGELRELVGSVMDEKDISVLKEDNSLAIDWDYILIDEGQDWSDAEKEIIYKIYGPNRVIVADGEDQFIRSHRKQVWQSGLNGACVENKVHGLRQKRNLMDFANAVASELGLKWRVEPNKMVEWSGGQVFIWKNYKTSYHKTIEEYNKSSGCDNYDILFLVPPGMVAENPRHFVKLAAWGEKDIKVFDGTNDMIRQSYPTDVGQCRLYQYESCRGLEGWVTVCLHFDELVEYKINEAKSNGLNSLELMSPEYYAYLWSLMPLTRPIDTLCITLSNPESRIGQVLKKVAENYSDFVHWDI